MHFKTLLVVLVFLSLAGCTATRKSAMNQENQWLQIRVKQLEHETQKKDRKLSDLEYELGVMRAESEKAKEVKIYSEKNTVASEAKKKAKFHQVTPKKIQLALQKAGFYKGTVDGNVGKATKKAILDFQKANGLKPDGIVGRETWLKLGMFSD